MLSARFSMALVAGLSVVSMSLAGCGTYVPALQEIPGDAADGQLLVQAIVTNVTCEVQNAVSEVIGKDIENVKSGQFKTRKTAWLDNWGIQMSLNLAVTERGGINPVVNWLPPSPVDAVFNLGGSANASAEATRTEKMGSYHTVPELVARGPCHEASRPGGPFMMQSDLKLREWLRHNVMLEGTGVAEFPSKKDGPLKQDVIQHQVKFEVVTGGSLTPGWRLARVSVNQSGSLLSATRTRTHTLVLTLGPADLPGVYVAMGRPAPLARVAAQPRAAPSLAAANAHLASEIGIAVRENLQR